MQPVLALVCAVTLPVSFVLMRLGTPPFTTHFYEFAWWSVIGILDGVVWWRGRRSPLASSPGAFVILFLWSVALWFLFEIINLRLGNWYYIYVTDDVAWRWLGAFISFGTVLPAIYLSAEAVRSFLPRAAFRPQRRRAPGWLAPLFIVLGAVSLLLPLTWPRYFFPLAWGFAFFLLEPVNHRLGAG